MSNLHEKGIYRHPFVYNGIADARTMQMPKDTRLLRDVKLAEVPAWIMARDFSAIGITYWS